MNWLRCSSADSGNSTSFIVRFWSANSLLNFSIAACWLPDVSLPRQKFTVPLAFWYSSSDGAFLAPSVVFVPSSVAVPPPPPSPLSSLPQAATSTAHENAAQSNKIKRLDTELPLVQSWFIERSWFGFATNAPACCPLGRWSCAAPA